jgi:quinol monooxygenase YgiN
MSMRPNQIQVFYELPILPGKARELREIARKMVAMNDAEEPGTLVYNVYINPEETLFTYLETYLDSETGLFHAKRFAEGVYVGQIIELTDGGRLCFYGNVSPEFKRWAADAGFEPEYFELIDCYVR